MPDDIYEDYVQMVKTGLKKKKEQYVKEYNILHSQKTTVSHFCLIWQIINRKLTGNSF